MYGRMQFADFVVSQALQLNTQCLQILAQAGPGETPSRKQLRALEGDLLRLASLWQMLHVAIGKSAYRAGRERIRRALGLLPADVEWVNRAARQLAVKENDERRLRALGQVAERLTQTAAYDAAADLSGLGDIFQAESECWRDEAALRQVQDSDLIEHGIARAYAKARRVCRAYAERPASGKRLRRALRWVRHCVSHLELLQPALSDKSKTHIWYMERLQANLEKQLLVQRFAAAAALADVKPKSRARVQAMAEARMERLQARSKKLMARAFEPKLEAYARSVGKAVRKLGLEEIVLMPPAAGAAAEPDEAGA